MTYATHLSHAATKLRTGKPAATVVAGTNALILSFRKLMKRRELDAISVREAIIRREDGHRRVNNLLR